MHTSFGLLAIFAAALASVACSSDPPTVVDAGPPGTPQIVPRDSGTVTPTDSGTTTTCKLLDKPSTLETCNQCIEQSCCTELNACLQAPECVTTDQCVSKCFDIDGGTPQQIQQCQVTCLDQRPNAKPLFLSAQGCVSQKCASACQ